MNYSDYIKKGATPFQKNFISLLKNEKSQKYYAEQLGVSPQNFNNWVRGNAVPDADKLAKIARCFNVSVDWLLGISDITAINTGISDFCKHTGLSENAVNALHIANSMGGKVSTVFNEMIEGGELWTICGLIGNMSDEIRDSYNELKMVDLSINKIRLSQINGKNSSLKQEELEILTKRQKELADKIEFEKWKIIKCTEDMVNNLLMSLSEKCDISDLDGDEILDVIEQYEKASAAVKEIDTEISKAPDQELKELLKTIKQYRSEEMNDTARIIRLHKPEYFEK